MSGRRDPVATHVSIIDPLTGKSGTRFQNNPALSALSREL
jgi:hypothetical protein